MKKPSDPHTPVLKWNSARSPVIILPFVPFPVVRVGPHISWLQTPSLRSNPASADPLAGTPSESANDPVCARRNDLSPPPPTSKVHSNFTVITLPLVSYLSDLSCLAGGVPLNFRRGSASLGRKNGARPVLRGTGGGTTCLAVDTGADISVRSSWSAPLLGLQPF